AALATPFDTPYARIASASPGTARSSTRAVASGVRSVGDRPVPPVVRTTSYRAETAFRSSASTGSPSATTTGPSTSKPNVRRPSTSTGPPRSLYTPAAARFEAVTTSARTRRAGDGATAAGSRTRSLAAPVTRSPTTLRHHPDPRDLGVPVNGLHHVNEREGGHAHTGERLHLHPGPIRGADGGAQRHPLVGDLGVHPDSVHGDRVGQRHQLGGALGGLDAGQPGHGERVTLRHALPPHHPHHLGPP